MLYALTFGSGFAALVYEVLWLRQLALLFGSTAQASATTLAVFFGGLALGSYIWGERAAASEHPLRTYAWLEVGVALAAGLYFELLDVYRAAYPHLHFLLGSDAVIAAARIGLAATMLLPAAVLIGGALPMLAQELIRHPMEIGRRGSLLYGANTLGGAAGALAAGFYLPIAVGVTRSYLVAISINVAVAAGALVLSRTRDRRPASVALRRRAGGSAESVPAVGRVRVRVLLIAFASGFAMLGLEVLWTRMFAQVLHNSVYSFAAILVSLLVALALGSFFAHALARCTSPPERVLAALAGAAALAVALSPFVFYWMTDGLQYLAREARWSAYVATVFTCAAVVIVPPTVLAGTVFPYLFNIAASSWHGAGRTLGRLAAVNTIGAIAGSLVAGFVLLGWFGLWASIRGMAFVYAAIAVALAIRAERNPWTRWLSALLLVSLLAVLDPSQLALVRIENPGERIRQVWQGRDATVAVLSDGDDLRITIDNSYTLGDTSQRAYEEMQSDLPMAIHPRPRSAFFLGLGTGITAGAALRLPLERVAAAELMPEVVTAARDYFQPWLHGLFTDPRARVVVEDGRNYLTTNDDRYDVIVGDLFVPWHAGSGSLYTKDTFEIVKSRLAPRGLFAQWLPLHQLSREEVGVITRTMLEVFPQVTLWRRDFRTDAPVVALVGQSEVEPFDAGSVAANLQASRSAAAVPREVILAFPLLFYAGNIGAARQAFDSYPVNSDDHPVIEYLSPILQRERAAGASPWFVSLELAQWYEEILGRVPPESDPYLADLSPAEKNVPRAGLARYETEVYRSLGRAADAERTADAFRSLAPAEIGHMVEPKE